MATPPPLFRHRLSTASSSAEVVLRPMDHQDLTEVLHNERSAYSHPWTEGIFRNCLVSGYENWVMEQEGKLCGHVVLSFVLDESHLLNICVAPGYQGAGLGRELLSFAIQRAKRKGVTGMFLEVRESNMAAIQLYESAGFREIGRRRGYYPARRGREDALVMLLPLEHEDD